MRGGISLTPGKNMEADSYLTYHDNAVYTLYFTLSNYIPLSGVLTVVLPEQIVITGDPYAALTPDELAKFKGIDNGYGTVTLYDVSVGKNIDRYYINYLVPVKIEAGEYTITFGGVRNPRSFDATGVFSMNSTDGEFQIGYGTLDNVRMNEMGKFTEMTIFQSESKNGVLATYTLEFTAIIPVSSSDVFYLLLPDSIDSPKEPICNPMKCLDLTTKCTSEKGRIVVEFIITDPDCLKENAVFSFNVEGIQNGNSMLHSTPV